MGLYWPVHSEKAKFSRIQNYRPLGWGSVLRPDKGFDSQIALYAAAHLTVVSEKRRCTLIRGIPPFMSEWELCRSCRVRNVSLHTSFSLISAGLPHRF